MNVEIDEEQILRDFDARLSAIGDAPLEGEFIQGNPGGWNDTLEEWQAAESVHQGFLPAWQIGQRTKEGWQKALGDLGDRYAPGGAEKVRNMHPALRLAYYTAEALVANFDFQTMRFKPRQERVNPTEPPPTADEEPAAKPEKPAGMKRETDDPE